MPPDRQTGELGASHAAEALPLRQLQQGAGRRPGAPEAQTALRASAPGWLAGGGP